MIVPIIILMLIILYYLNLKRKYKIKLKDKYGKNWLVRIRKEMGILDAPPPIDRDKKIPPGFKAGNLIVPRPGSKKFDDAKLYGNHDRDEEGTRMMRGWWPSLNGPNIH